jgi:hypothetical protein
MKVDREGLRKLVRITLERESEDRTWVGEFQREDGSNDEELNAWIKSELDSGNYWAWCVAHVTVELGEFKGEDWLGGCSYESEEDFKKGGYYESMIAEACDELAKDIEKLVNTHGLFEHDKVTCLWCAAEPL